MRAFGRYLRSRLIAGILVLVPLGVTYFVLKWIFNALDSILAPYIEHLIGRDIPGLGLAATIILILLAGLLGTNVLGKHLFAYLDRGLARVPVVSGIYTSTKQFMEAIGTTSTKSFKRVVMVEYPRKGLLTFGFVTKDVYTVAGKDGSRTEVMNVFVPSTPNPTTGFLIVVQKSQVIGVDLSVEDGIKLVVSGGIISPARQYISDGVKPLIEPTTQEGLPGGPATGGSVKISG
jgi:uncharacterized membrane protein